MRPVLRPAIAIYLAPDRSSYVTGSIVIAGGEYRAI
jgi:hypothetical protein